jgi:hypothetical protein
VNDRLLEPLTPEQRLQLMDTLLALRERARTTEPLRQPPTLRKAG